jgi:hypothetical protein
VLVFARKEARDLLTKDEQTNEREQSDARCENEEQQKGRGIYATRPCQCNTTESRGTGDAAASACSIGALYVVYRSTRSRTEEEEDNDADEEAEKEAAEEQKKQETHWD